MPTNNEYKAAQTVYVDMHPICLNVYIASAKCASYAGVTNDESSVMDAMEELERELCRLRDFVNDRFRVISNAMDSYRNDRAL